MNHQKPLYESHYMGFWIKVFSNKVEFKGSTGTNRVLLSQIASVEPAMMGVWQVTIKTTRGAKYTIPTSKKNEVQEAIYRAQEELVNPSKNSNVSVADELTKLVKLKKEGVLSEKQFEEQKSKVIGSSEKNDETPEKEEPKKTNDNSKRKDNKGFYILIAGICAVLLLLVLFSALSSEYTEEISDVLETEEQKEDLAPTSTLRGDFRANVRFDGAQFIIANLDDLDCENSRMQVKVGGIFSDSYSLDGYTLEAGEVYTVGALQFAKGDGTRFNPYEVKPRGFFIFCSALSSNDLKGASWYGEFR